VTIVDESTLRYVEACGFRPTDAGMIHLPSVG